MLTAEQIDYLFTFCANRGVVFYEVQAELVDHLSHSIEKQTEENSSIQFLNALNHAFEEFGWSGFHDIVKEKAKLTEKSVKKQYWLDVKQQLKWPRGVAGVLLVGVLFYQFFLVANELTYQVMAIASLLALVAASYYEVRMARFLKKSGKQFMTLQYNSHFFIVTAGWTIVICFNVFVKPDGAFFGRHPQLWAVILSGYTALFLMLSYSAIRLTIKIRQRIAVSFP